MKEIEGFEKGVSPLNPPGSGENNENDSSQEKLMPNFQSNKMVVKQFMSPTISAASKAAAPIKKILVDRNENSGTSDSQIHRSSNFEPKRSSRNSSMSHSDQSLPRVNLPYNGASESDDDGDVNLFANSSLKSYDPLTNYLTPRPKYMRFDPNRRLEVLNRLEIEGRDDLYGCFESLKVNDEEESSSSEDVKDSSFSPLKESVVKQQIEESAEEEGENMSNVYEEEMEMEDEEEEEEDEDEEELEEERGWCLRGVLKVLLTLIACLFSTSYICSMNSPTHLPTQQQAIWGLRDGYMMIQNRTFETHASGFLAVEEGDRFLQLVEVEIDENDNVENKKRVEPESVEDEVNSEGLVELLENENEDNADESGRVAEIEEVVAGEFAQFIDVKAYGYEKEVEALNHGSNMDNAVKTEAAENEVVGGDVVESEIESFQQLIGARTDVYEDFGGHGLEKEVEDAQEQQQLKHFEVLDDIKSVEEEYIIGSQEKSTDSILEVVEVGYQNEGEMDKSGFNNPIIIGVVSVVSIIFASIAFFYRSNKARSSTSASIQAQPVLEEEMIPSPPAIEKKIEFFARPSLRPPMDEAQEELNHNINVPTVKLIGEIDVGEVSSSYLRSWGSKYQMIESEESNATSFYPKQSPLPQPFSSPTQPSAMEISTTSSHSHGSFTTEMKILKKEGGGKNGKAKIEVITPVRRSSRLRNRDSVMSSP